MSNKVKVNPKNQDILSNYKLLIGSIIPRPIGFISTIDNNGTYNLAPFSFFNGVCSNPPTVLFCPVLRGSDGSEKDTLRNIRSNKEFVVNIVSEDFAEKMNITAGEFPYGIDEFKESGLTPEPSELIKPPRVKESKINMECKLTQIVDVGKKGDPGSGAIVIGEVIFFHIQEDVYKDGKILNNVLKPIGRLGGSEYCRTTDNFVIERPTKKG